MHILEMILLISLLIIVHEAGHFFVARLFGIRVDRVGFGLPIGPTLYEKKIGDITYCIHAFLLGGYVGFPDDDPNSTIPLDDPDRISNRPAWQKFFVVSAGVTMNIIFAYLIVFFVAIGSRVLPSNNYNITINSIMENNSPAKYAGLEKNDKLVSINGVEIRNLLVFTEVIERSSKFNGYVEENLINDQLQNIKNTNKKLKINDNEKIPVGIKLTIPVAKTEKPITVKQDFYLEKRPVPSGIELTKEEIKLRNSLENKKEYISDGTYTLNEIAKATADTVHPISIVVERNGKNIKLNDIYPTEKGKIGVALNMEEIKIPIKNPIDVIVYSNDYIIKNTWLMIDGLVKLVMGKVSPDNLHGVVAIVKVGGNTLKHSIWDGLLLTSLISIDLAIVNLLPIPALDGGYIFFLLIEKIIGRPINEKISENLSKICFLLLILLMILIVFNDIWALLQHKF